MVCIYCSQVMKIHQSAVILLLVVCAPLSSYSQTYQHFINKHLAPAGMKIDDCTNIIKGKGIKLKIPNKAGTYCNPINTFIQTTEDAIKGICTNVNQHTGIFNVIECTLLNNMPPCTYGGTFRAKHEITVTCDKSLPVHYGPPRSTNG